MMIFFLLFVCAYMVNNKNGEPVETALDKVIHGNPRFITQRGKFWYLPEKSVYGKAPFCFDGDDVPAVKMKLSVSFDELTLLSYKMWRTGEMLQVLKWE